MFFRFGLVEYAILAMILAGVFVGNKTNGRGVLGGTLFGTSLIVLIVLRHNFTASQSWDQILVVRMLFDILIGGTFCWLVSALLVWLWPVWEILERKVTRQEGKNARYIHWRVGIGATLVLLWALSTWRWIQQRHEFLQQPIIGEKTFAAENRTRAPGLLPLLGVRGYQDISLGGEMWQLDEAGRLFPEAKIHWETVPVVE